MLKDLASKPYIPGSSFKGAYRAHLEAMLRGMDVVLSNATGLDVRVANDPMTCVARGTAVYLENLELWKDTMESDEDEF